MNWWLVLIAIVLAGAFPMVPLLIANAIGFKLNESSSVIATLPWLLFFTVPIASCGLVGWLAFGVLLLFRGPER